MSTLNRFITFWAALMKMIKKISKILVFMLKDLFFSINSFANFASKKLFFAYKCLYIRF